MQQILSVSLNAETSMLTVKVQEEKTIEKYFMGTMNTVKSVIVTTYIGKAHTWTQICDGEQSPCVSHTANVLCSLYQAHQNGEFSIETWKHTIAPM